MDKEPTNEIDFERIAKWLKLGGLFVLGTCLLFYIVRFWNVPSGEPDSWGQFGDYIGGVAGTLLSLATLIALAYTLRIQAAQLKAAKRQADDQAALLNRQSFEATFFKMLENFSGLAIIAAIESHTNQLLGGVYGASTKTKTNASAKLSAMQAEWDESYGNYEKWLGPYFRSLYHILKFVDSANLEPADKYRYASIVRSRLTPHELLLLFVNCGLGSEGRNGELRPLVGKYAMLKHARRQNFDPAIKDLIFELFGKDAYASQMNNETSS